MLRVVVSKWCTRQCVRERESGECVSIIINICLYINRAQEATDGEASVTPNIHPKCQILGVLLQHHESSSRRPGQGLVISQEGGVVGITRPLFGGMGLGVHHCYYYHRRWCIGLGAFLCYYYHRRWWCVRGHGAWRMGISRRPAFGGMGLGVFLCFGNYSHYTANI